MLINIVRVSYFVLGVRANNVITAAIACSLDPHLNEYRTKEQVENSIEGSTSMSRFCDHGYRFADGMMLETIKCTVKNGSGLLSKPESDCQGSTFSD